MNAAIIALVFRKLNDVSIINCGSLKMMPKPIDHAIGYVHRAAAQAIGFRPAICRQQFHCLTGFPFREVILDTGKIVHWQRHRLHSRELFSILQAVRLICLPALFR